MEFLSIILSVPVAFLVSMVYCGLLVKAARRSERGTVYDKGRRRAKPLIGKVVRMIVRARHSIYHVSLLVLGMIVVEMLLLATLGVVRSRAVVGPSFYLLHVACFFLGTPALGNVLILAGRGPLAARKYIAVALCTILASFLILLQYSVSEALYGLDGSGGPYS